MKTLTLILLLISINLLAQNDLGQRYLKLGNTYREADDFEKAEEYLSKGKKIVSSGSTWNNRYWSAVANEYFAYLYNDLSKNQKNINNKDYFKQLSMEYFNKAKNQYENLIKTNDGSQDAISEVIKNLNGLESKFNSNHDNSFNSERNSGKNSNKVLNFEKLKLKELPTGIGDNVENLSLAENKFKEFPPGLSKFKNLKYLNLSENKIKSISPDIEQLKNLKWLDLSDNKIKKLPENLCNLTGLERLDLMNNNLKEIPACLCQMTNLKILNLKDNKLEYPQIVNIIKCLPNTNILIDEYELVKEKNDEVETAIPNEK